MNEWEIFYVKHDDVFIEPVGGGGDANGSKKNKLLWAMRCTHLSLNWQTSSMRKARSARVACVTHFSTTFDANLCCDNSNTLPRTLAINTDLSSAFPCSVWFVDVCVVVEAMEVFIARVNERRKKREKNKCDWNEYLGWRDVWCTTSAWPLTQNMLNDIVSVLILNQILGVCMQFGKNWCGLFGGAVLENSLDDTASIRMCAECVHLTRECGDDELKCDGFDAFNTFLYHMISILILNTFQYMSVQFTNNLLLLLRWNAFECLLNDTATIHLQCQRQHMTFDLLGQGWFLFGCAKFKEFLNHIIAKHIGHQTVGRRQDFIEHQLLLSGRGTLQFLLNEPRTVLILRKFNNVIGQITQLQIWIALIAEIFKQTRTARCTIECGGCWSCCRCSWSSRYSDRNCSGDLGEQRIRWTEDGVCSWQSNRSQLIHIAVLCLCTWCTVRYQCA